VNAESLDAFLVAPAAPVRAVVEAIDRNARGIALVVDAQGCLLGTVTDGDIRRAVLAQVEPATPVSELLESKRDDPVYSRPVTAPDGTAPSVLIHLMTERAVRHLPLLDEDGRVVDLALLDDLLRDYELPISAVVMAGGFGTRLKPLTDDVPKPMLPVGGRPVLEHIVEQMRASGIRRVNLTTHYRPESIAEHFGSGEGFGVDIGYVHETEPLGTAGALRLLDESSEPLLVMNGDILTRLDFRAMLDFHREHEAVMTVAVRPEEFQLPYGVVELDGPLVKSLTEKPVFKRFVNAGIYLLEPAVRNYLPDTGRFDMPHLIDALLNADKTVASFPIREYWLDVGQMSSYEQAERDHEAGKLS
jgi:dTDP-glucose pyrophosphorylase/CBS domain-containing protein